MDAVIKLDEQNRRDEYEFGRCKKRNWFAAPEINDDVDRVKPHTNLVEIVVDVGGVLVDSFKELARILSGGGDGAGGWVSGRFDDSLTRFDDSLTIVVR